MFQVIFECCPIVIISDAATFYLKCAFISLPIISTGNSSTEIDSITNVMAI